MRLLVVTFVILIQCGFLFGQDGSDMNYVKPAQLNDSYVGRRLHLDFGQRSFGADRYQANKPLDTIFIEVNGKKVKFIERRVDDGYNNWFSEQYLESVEKTDGLTLIIKEFELLKINKNDILVKAFFIVNKADQALPDKSFTKDLSFEKKEIIEFLFKAKD